MLARIFLLLPLFLVACASQTATPPSTSPQTAVPSGRWMGTISFVASPNLSGSEAEDFQVIYLNCSRMPRLWRLEKNGKWGRHAKDFQTRSLAGTHLFFLLAKENSEPPGWIESQAWSLVELEPRVLIARHSRSVNNTGLPPSSPEASFGYTAYGELRWQSDDCGAMDDSGLNPWRP